MPVAPGYLRQSGLPKTTGVRSLPNVQISDSINQAITQGSQVGAAIGGKLLEAQAESEVSTATTNAQLKLSQLETKLSTMDGLAANEAFAGEKERIYNEASSIITSKKGRQTFNKAWNVVSTKSQISVQAAGTKRKYQQLEGNLLSNLDNLRRGLGPKGKNPIERSLADTTGRAMIDRAVKSNVITAPQGEKLYLKLRGGLAKSGLNEIIRESKLEDLDALADSMSADSFVSKDTKRMWDDLDDTEKLAMQSKVRTAYERHVNTLEKREVQGVAKIKRSQAVSFSGSMKKIIASRRLTVGQSGLPAPTKSELLDDLAAGRINEVQYGKLEAALDNRDPVGNTDDAVKGFIGKIRDAQDADEIKDVIVEMEDAIGPSGSITFDDFEKLERRALAAKPNTPGERRITAYSKALDKVLASTDFLDKILPGSKARVGFVQLDFEARIADGQDPEEAFTAAIESFNTRQRVILNSIPRPEFGHSKPLSEWQIEHVEESLATTKYKLKGSPNTLATQLLILNSIRAYIEQRDAGMAAGAANGGTGATNKEKLDKLRGAPN